MTSCWAAYAISISRSVVMPLFMWGRLLSLDIRGNAGDRVEDGGVARVWGHAVNLLRRFLSRCAFAHPMILPVISSTVPNLITNSPEVARKPTQTVYAKAA